MGVRRHDLPDGAWIDRFARLGCGAPIRSTVPPNDTCRGAPAPSASAGAHVPRPRLVASVDRAALPDELDVVGKLADTLSQRYGVRLDAITCNLYRSGARQRRVAR